VKGSAYFRSRDRKAPYNLYSRTSVLRRAGARGWRGPSRVFEFGEAPAALVRTAATRLVAPISTGITAGFRWDAAAGRWRRQTNGTDHLVAGGGPILVDNVLVQYTEYRNTNATDRSGAAVPEASVVGSGRLLFLSGPTVTAGTWSKASAEAPFVYRDTAGTPIVLARGRTWISLVPATMYGRRQLS
jgi:hypothetical protein